MPVYEVMLEMAVRFTERIPAENAREAKRKVRTHACEELQERGFSSLEIQDSEVSEVRS